MNLYTYRLSTNFVVNACVAGEYDNAGTCDPCLAGIFGMSLIFIKEIFDQEMI